MDFSLTPSSSPSSASSSSSSLWSLESPSQLPVSQTPLAPNPPSIPSVSAYTEYIKQHALKYTGAPPPVDSPSFPQWEAKFKKVEIILHKKYMVKLSDTIQQVTSCVTPASDPSATTAMYQNKPQQQMSPQLAMQAQLNNLWLQQQANASLISGWKQKCLEMQQANERMQAIIAQQAEKMNKLQRECDEQHWMLVGLKNKNYSLHKKFQASQKQAQCSTIWNSADIDRELNHNAVLIDDVAEMNESDILNVYCFDSLDVSDISTPSDALTSLSSKW